MLGGLLGGCGSDPVVSVPVLTPEQQACQAWGDAFNTTGAGMVTGANSAAAIAPKTPAGQLMNVFLVSNALPGGADDPQTLQALVLVREVCAKAGVPFDYPA